ncbi:hypothetical protein OQA88_8771 [Cercophora sp. LCS_1]
MAEIFYDQSKASVLAGKTIVIAGASQGIGAATLTLLNSLGANTFFTDLSPPPSTIASLPSPAPVYIPGDVTSHKVLTTLFETAFTKTGRIDAAIFCAAISEPPALFSPETLTRESLLAEDKVPEKLQRSLDINLTAALNFSRVALGYINSIPQDATLTPSLTLISSIAGITPAPGLFTYASAKHGIIGLTRSLAPYTPGAFHGTRVNAVCPWATDTQLLAGPVKTRWLAEKMPLNTPLCVAKQITQLVLDSSLNGRVVYVAGGRGFDTEAGVEATRPVWMGAENNTIWERGQEILGLGDGWTEK